MSRSQRHSEYIRGVAADGKRAAQGLNAFGYYGPGKAIVYPQGPFNLASSTFGAGVCVCVMSGTPDMDLFRVGETIKIAGVGDALVDGNRVVTAVNAGAKSFSFATTTFTTKGAVGNATIISGP